MLFRQIVDTNLAQNAYLVGCQRTGEALVIDPERDIDRYLEIAEAEGLRITAVTETHIHADFLSGVREFAARGVKAYLSEEGGEDWSYRWPELGDYDIHFLRDGDAFKIGNISLTAFFSPGHTPEHIAFLVTDLGGGADEPMGLVSGDFVFVGDTGRPDLLESAAGVAGAMELGADTLFDSVQRFLELPDYLQVWPGHGAGSACGKALGAIPESTVGYERRFSPAIKAALGGSESFRDYVLDGQPEPPMYFARMKRQNRDGPAVLGELPKPRRLDSPAIDGLTGSDGPILIDTRLDRSAFMKGHVPGSLYAPLDKSFPTILGSYVDDSDEFVLIVDEDDLDEAVRNCIRIGLDKVVAYVTPNSVAEWRELGGEFETIPEADMADIEALREAPGTLVVDVRRLAEFREGHVPEALNVAHTRLRTRIDEIPTGKHLLVHCRSGNRAAPAAAMLARNGHAVTYVNGLFEDWWEEHGSRSQEGAEIG